MGRRLLFVLPLLWGGVRPPSGAAECDPLPLLDGPPSPRRKSLPGDTLNRAFALWETKGPDKKMTLAGYARATGISPQSAWLDAHRLTESGVLERAGEDVFYFPRRAEPLLRAMRMEPPLSHEPTSREKHPPDVAPAAKTLPRSLRSRLSRLLEWTKRGGQKTITRARYVRLLGVSPSQAHLDIVLARSAGVLLESEGKDNPLLVSSKAEDILQTTQATPMRSPQRALLLALRSGRFAGEFSASDLTSFLMRDRNSVGRNIHWGIERGIVEKLEKKEKAGAQERSLYRFLSGAKDILLQHHNASKKRRITPLGRTLPKKTRDRLLHVWQTIGDRDQNVLAMEYARIANISHPMAHSDIDLGKSVGVFEVVEEPHVRFSNKAHDILETIEPTPYRPPAESFHLAMQSGQFDKPFTALEFSLFLGRKRNMNDVLAWGTQRGVIERMENEKAKHPFRYRLLDGAEDIVLQALNERIRAPVAPLENTMPRSVRNNLMRAWNLGLRDVQETTVEEYARLANIAIKTAHDDIQVAELFGAMEKRKGVGIRILERMGRVIQTIATTPPRRPARSLLLALRSEQFQAAFTASDLAFFLGKKSRATREIDVRWGLKNEIIKKISPTRQRYAFYYAFVEGAEDHLLRHLEDD